MIGLDVLILTNLRCPPLLDEIIEAWRRRGVEPSVIVNTRPVPPPPSWVQEEARKLVRSAFVFVTVDDILPVGEWPDLHWAGRPNTLAGLRTLDVEGRRAFDWARWKDGAGLIGLQHYAEPADDRTYLGAGNMVWSRDAFDRAPAWPQDWVISDIVVCRQARAAGIELVAPAPDGPTLIHLERRYPTDFVLP